jgi:exopolysaccharide transport family protein
MNFAGPTALYQVSGNEPSSGTLSMLQIRDFAGRQWRLITLITALTLVAWALYIAVSPFRYTAEAEMVIDTKRMTWTQSELTAESHSIEDAAVESELETTRSEKVATRVINRLHLTEDPEFVGNGRSLKRIVFSLLRLPTGPDHPSSNSDVLRTVLETLNANLRVTRLARSYIEQISYTSRDRDKAATIANAFADAYIEDQLQAKFEATRRASIWLEQRIGELREQASDAYRKVQDFKSENGIIIGVDGKLASEVELDQLGVALAKARADTSQARARFERISKVLEQRNDSEGTDLPDPVVTDALNNPVITRLRQQFLDDKSKESEWSARYGVNHLAARDLRSDMANLQRAMWDELGRIAESYKSELQITKSQEDAIDKRMAEVFQKSATTRQSQVHLRELESAANTYKGIYETFLTRFTQSVQQQSFPSTEARVVTPASPPMHPSSPKSALTFALAIVIGLGLGVALALLREQMSRQIHTRAQLEQLIGTSCLAVIPSFNARATRFRRPNAARTQAAFRQISEAPPFSSTAEALRYIKVAIDLNPSGGKVIGMVSALPGEGKTTVTAGFAAFLAKSGAKTLLVDADLRNPSATRLLGHSGAPGLVSMVREESTLENFVISDANLRFDLLPSSTQVKSSNSSDVLNSQTMKDMLKAARSAYDYVLVDLPPILPVVDVKAIAGLLDAYVLVVEWGSTSTEELIRAVNTSPIVSDRLIGAVLNKADEAVMRRFEGYSDRRYAYYTNDTTAAAIV